MVFCSKCGSENENENMNCENCGEFLIKREHMTANILDRFEEMFTPERKLAITSLTADAYSTIITNITDMGHYRLREYYTTHSRKNLTILDKIKAITTAYAPISYKSRGAELGSYSFNSIRVDDRLDEAQQISTLIHELSHHLFSEIFEQALMYVWKCSKSDAVEALAWFILIGSSTTQLMNEYCAHTCQGRFIPHGYQNYGSFNNILSKEFNPEKDKDAVLASLVMANTIAQDIIGILEEFIDDDMREEIKQQFKRDFTYAPKYDQIGNETNEVLPEEMKIKSVTAILTAGYLAAQEKGMDEILKTFKENFEEINED